MPASHQNFISAVAALTTDDVQSWNFDERRASIEYDFDVDVVSSFYRQWNASSHSML
jgi:hypothetical protein